MIVVYDAPHAECDSVREILREWGYIGIADRAAGRDTTEARLVAAVESLLRLRWPAARIEWEVGAARSAWGDYLPPDTGGTSMTELRVEAVP